MISLPCSVEKLGRFTAAPKLRRLFLQNKTFEIQCYKHSLFNHTSVIRWMGNSQLCNTLQLQCITPEWSKTRDRQSLPRQAWNSNLLSWLSWFLSVPSSTRKTKSIQKRHQNCHLSGWPIYLTFGNLDNEMRYKQPQADLPSWRSSTQINRTWNSCAKGCQAWHLQVWYWLEEKRILSLYYKSVLGPF